MQSFLQQPVYVAGMLCLLLLISNWLAGKKGFRFFGVPLIVIVLTAIVANAGIIPTATGNHPVYVGIFKYLAPLGIFILLLEVNLRSLKQAGTAMILMFTLGAIATMLGVFLAYHLWQPQHLLGKDAAAIAGMYTGTYIGGSINFNAVAIQYGINNNGPLFAATTVADNLAGTPWIIFTLLIPRLLQRWFPRKKVIQNAGADAVPENKPDSINLFSLAALFGLGLLSMFVSDWISSIWPAIPSILTLTTIALLIAQLPLMKKIKGTHVTGLFLIYIFLAAVGALCDIPSLLANGKIALLLLAFVGTVIAVHGIVVFGVGGLLRYDWDLLAVASQANIGGTTTAIVSAESLQRPDLLLPGLLAGSMGNALGTYAGLFMAGIL